MLYHAVKLGRLPQNNQMYHETYPNVTGHLLPLDVNFQFVYATVKKHQGISQQHPGSMYHGKRAIGCARGLGCCTVSLASYHHYSPQGIHFEKGFLGQNIC